MPEKVPYALRRVVLPEHPILYTLDQVAIILSVSDSWLRQRVSFVGREQVRPHTIRAINIAEPGERPEWRIPEKDLKVWLSRHGYKIREA